MLLIRWFSGTWHLRGPYGTRTSCGSAGKARNGILRRPHRGRSPAPAVAPISSADGATIRQGTLRAMLPKRRLANSSRSLARLVVNILTLKRGGSCTIVRGGSNHEPTEVAITCRVA
jgi:hypothetical protein